MVVCLAVFTQRSLYSETEIGNSLQGFVCVSVCLCVDSTVYYCMCTHTLNYNITAITSINSESYNHKD